MKTVKITMDVRDWYAHASKGGMRWNYYGGICYLEYKEHMKCIHVDPHSKIYATEDVCIMDMVNQAISLLKEPCIIKLSIPQSSFPYEPLKKGIYKYWKRNNWCYKSGMEANSYWIEYDRLVSEGGHIVEVL